MRYLSLKLQEAKTTRKNASKISRILLLFLFLLGEFRYRSLPFHFSPPFISIIFSSSSFLILIDQISAATALPVQISYHDLGVSMATIHETLATHRLHGVVVEDSP